MTETTSAPGASPEALQDPGPEPLPPAGATHSTPPPPRGSDRFFSWVAGFGLTRTEGWLGGVCAGIAARLRIDPIIVRGVFAVVALFGLPAFLVYAIAWALLPDANGRIHLRELFHGRFDSALVGIALLLLVGIFPVLPWTWGGFWYPSSVISALPVLTPFSVLAVLFSVALVGAIIYLGVRLSNRTLSDSTTPGTSTPDSQRASANPAVPALPTEQAPDSGDGARGGDVVDPDAATLVIDDDAASGSTPSHAPTSDAPSSDAELAAWRERHAAWRVQNEAWRRQQHDHGRAAKEQARQERDAAGAAFAADAAERRRVRKATKPRTSFVFVIAVSGAAIVAGAASALAALDDIGTAPFAAAIGLLVAGIVTAIAMVVAGLARRRSGFLAFVAFLLVFTGVVTSTVSGQALTLGSANLITRTEPQTVTQPFGHTQVSLSSLSDGESVQAGTMTIRKGTGETYIDVHEGTALELDASLVGGEVAWNRIDNKTNGITDSGFLTPRYSDDGRSQFEWRSPNDGLAGDPVTTQRVRLDQTGPGSVFITIYEP